ncbi:Yip1 family protein [Dokdonella koreensis]|uniref:DUF1282 domain containing protein n=1 Tax=Dokdonella koreensis DS-123 TaxID=1300342 RepID=A0A167GQA1_9GAMM|nr:Yip1 family protein [Dokdonella koreensis]ANB17076.1 DUF1282 domain containing protein [Dokdonella koreensis DS-123]
MDFTKLIERVKNILLTPKTEWPVIGAETTTVADLYKNYILILAALPAIFGFIQGSLIGTTIPFVNISLKVPVGIGIAQMLLTYGLSLGLMYVLALIVDALAPSFGGEKSLVQALKTLAYAWTPAWIVSVLGIVPAIGMLAALAALVYSIYLLYLGLPHTMKIPKERSGGYTAVTIIIGIVLSIVVGWVAAMFSGVSAYSARALQGQIGAIGIPAEAGKDTSLAKVEAWGEKMEAAGKKVEAAQKSGDGQVQAEAVGQLIGAALGGGDQVEALAPDALKPFLPESLAGWKRTAFSAEQNGAMGMQMSVATATYAGEDGKALHLEITDVGSAKGLLGLAGMANVQSQRESDDGYEKTWKENGRLVNEKWDGPSRRGEYSIILGDRFTVELSGTVDNIDQLKSALAGLDLAGLEALKNQGVKRG